MKGDTGMFNKQQYWMIVLMAGMILFGGFVENNYAQEESQPQIEKVFVSSYVHVSISRNPKKGEGEGWKPFVGVKVVTEEDESGVTGDNGYVEIPVYTKAPFELIEIKIGGRTFEVPTFGEKEDIKGGLIGSIHFGPDAKQYISIFTCPDVYDYLKKTYELDVHPYDKDKDGNPKLDHSQFSCE